VFGGLETKDLIALRLEAIYFAQKVERAMIAQLSDVHRQKNSRDYTAEQLNAGKKEVEHADFMLRTSAKNILPTLEALAAEGVISR
jgi:hypothetical protein